MTANLTGLIAIQFGLCIAIGLVVGRTLMRLVLASILLIAALALPVLAYPPPFERAALTLLALVALIKSVPIASAKAEWQSPGRRLWQILVPFDIRRARRVAPGAVGSSLARILVAAAVIALVLWYGMTRSGRLPDRWAFTAQLACALVFAYSLMELGGEVLRTLHRLVGIEIGPLQRDPVLSRSVSEFWGERWNVPVTNWLNEFFFRPLARKRRATAGIVLAFVVSTALHAWLFFVAIGWWGALLASSFFLIQIPAVLIERRLGVRRWPTAAQRVWTLGFLLAASPLFVWPLLRGLEMQLAGR